MEEKKTLKISLSTFFLILAIIVIIVMAYFIYKLNNEKINAISNPINSNNENTSITSDSYGNKYEELTEYIYNQLAENEYFIIQNVMQNTNGTITLKGRVYENVELTSISKDEYNSLKSSGNITLWGENFSLGEYEDFVPGYILKNSNGYGFYVTDNYELVDFNDTNFVKGTDKYYIIALDDNVKLKLPDDTEETIKVSSINTTNDNDFINLENLYDFEFNNGNLSKIIYKMY